MSITLIESKNWERDLELRATAAGQIFTQLVKTVGALRHPDTGCPWDLEQNHKSLRRYMLEEAYEASEAMLGSNDVHLLEELGDVLLQVVLNAQLAAERKVGTICEVVKGLNDKMLRRHPHVFGELVGKGSNLAQVQSSWDVIKMLEKSKAKNEAESFFEEQKKVLPALTQASKIGKQAQLIAFDWDSPEEVFDQVKAELHELEAELVSGNKMRLQDELGDVFFSLAQLSRHLGIDPESAAQQGNLKFLKRFSEIEIIARQRNLEITKLTRVQLELLWQEVKMT